MGTWSFDPGAVNFRLKVSHDSVHNITSSFPLHIIVCEPEKNKLESMTCSQTNKNTDATATRETSYEMNQHTSRYRSMAW